MLRRKISPFVVRLVKDTVPVRLLYRYMMSRAPYLINCELTTRCNLNCRMCSRPKWLSQSKEFKIGDMPHTVLDRVLDGIEELKDRDLVFMTNGLGEPLLYPGLIEVIEEARRRAPNIRFSITTNAITLNTEMTARLIEAGVDDLTISLNTADSESYAKLMGANQYDKVVKNILDFMETRKILRSERPRLSLQFLETALTRLAKKGFYDFWEPKLARDDKVFVHEPVSHAGSADIEGLVSYSKRVSKYPCSQCWRRLAVRINGDVYPCDAAYYAYGRIPELLLGNVLDTPLKDIYFGKGAKVDTIRKSQLLGDYSGLGPCACCDTFKLTPNAFFHIPLFLKRKWV